VLGDALVIGLPVAGEPVRDFGGRRFVAGCVERLTGEGFDGTDRRLAPSGVERRAVRRPIQIDDEA
jgi:hypothetical protein